MNVVVSYDITDDRRRAKLAKLMKDYGTRVQYSVFEVIVDTRRFKKMCASIKKVIKGDEDSVRLYFLCGSCLNKVLALGKNEECFKDEKYIIV